MAIVHCNRTNCGYFSSITRSLSLIPNMAFLLEVFVRIILLFMFIHADFQVSEGGVIQQEDLWRYRYPLKTSVVPFSQLLVFIFFSTTAIIIAFGSSKKFMNISERRQAILSFTLSLLLAGVVINYMKLWIGRPRPNYLMRCYGDSYLKVMDSSKPCTVTTDWVGDKSKSFPSGHSGTAFSAFVFQSLYLAGKLGAFNAKGAGTAGRGWRVVVSFIPIMMSVWVACTRFTDYHHHVEDIMIGSLIGTAIAYLSYRLYYPSLTNNLADCPSAWLEMGYPNPSAKQPKVEFIMPPKNRLTPSSIQEGMNLDGSGKLIDAPFSGNANTTNSRTRTLKGLYFTEGNISVEIVMSRRVIMPPAAGNNPNVPTVPKTSISFYWDDNSEGGDLDQNEVGIMSEELRNAVANFSAEIQRQNR